MNPFKAIYLYEIKISHFKKYGTKKDNHIYSNKITQAHSYKLAQLRYKHKYCKYYEWSLQTWIKLKTWCKNG